MIGALVLSDKPVVVNSGSFGTTVVGRHLAKWSIYSDRQRCRFDQIVPFEKQARNTSL
jgi:hypothetical protein